MKPNIATAPFSLHIQNCALSNQCIILDYLPKKLQPVVRLAASTSNNANCISLAACYSFTTYPLSLTVCTFVPLSKAVKFTRLRCPQLCHWTVDVRPFFKPLPYHKCNNEFFSLQLTPTDALCWSVNVSSNKDCKFVIYHIYWCIMQKKIYIKIWNDGSLFIDFFF